MAPTIPYGEPTRVVAGDSWIWKRSVPEYPVTEGWALSYRFAGAEVLETDPAEVTDDGSATFTIEIPAAKTDNIVAGSYQWAAIATGSGAYAGRRDTVATGVLIVDPNIATANPGDLQLTEEVQLAAVEAVISGRITRDVERVMIGSQQVDKIPILQLYQIRDRLKRAIWRQQHPSQPFVIARAILR